MTPTALALDALAKACVAAGLPWSATWREPLAALCEAVAAGARQTNLVGDPSPDGVCAHVVEALAVVACAADAGARPRLVADIGAGAGIAALTYAVAWPEARVFAVEPRRLRAEFVRAAAPACGVADRVVVVQRSLASAVAGGELGAGLDLADARAVWPMDQWLAHARPLVRSAGHIAVHLRAGDGAAQPTGAPQPIQWRRAVPGPRGYLVGLAQV